MPASIDPLLAALADPVRREVIELLHRRPRAAGELAAAFGMSPPAMSRHLRVLRVNGLVEEHHDSSEDARFRVYRLRREPFQKLRNWIADIESFWGTQLDSFREHTEQTRRRKPN